jgi:sporulation protein YlmC with PRC-barrel domain
MSTKLIDIPINVEVDCANFERCGRSTYAVLNPVTKKITHVVVEERAFPHVERLVPVELIAETSPNSIRLTCDAPSLGGLEPFIETHFIHEEEPRFMTGPYLMWPFSFTTEEYRPVDRKNIPVDELAIRRGADVQARDGHVGRVDEFVVDQKSEHITHLVLREGHIWGKKDVTIPVAYIDTIDAGTVYLNIDKAGVAELPTVPLKRA